MEKVLSMICMQRAETMTVNMQNLQRRRISTGSD